ncbi:DUF4288 domain-containing protein [Marininema halotolerans]|uniref:DUF4288 domain-containing protein n=1 Tax=Marininema halotolerans TaxID=1155944 RepID=A0A1I6NVH8_9BACL|nr:DUF4288 domain-containing protein [Marininema halotolerans]SFS31953.1 protein of unknown function [Marininema halotolerans]
MKDHILISWYSVSCLFESIQIESVRHNNIDKNKADLRLFEEKIILVKASDEHEAYEIAGKYARDDEFEYLNGFGEKVRVRFVTTLHAFEIFDQELGHGVEVYSRFIHATNQDTSGDIVRRYFPMD